MTENCTSKLLTRPLVREGVPLHEDRKCPTIIQIWPWAPDGGPTSRQTDRQNVGKNNLIWQFLKDYADLVVLRLCPVHIQIYRVGNPKAFPSSGVGKETKSYSVGFVME
jgi:hypothetical protein